MKEILTWADEGGSIYYQAKLHDAFDYRGALDKAAHGDTKALSCLFAYTKNGSQTGEGAETHIEVIGELLKQWGDAEYARVLSDQPTEEICSVAKLLSEYWGYPGWPRGKYPITQKLCAESINAEQVGGGNGDMRF